MILVSNASVFSKQIDRAIERALVQQDKNINKIVRDVYTVVIQGTPVLRGNLINDYHFAVNGFNTTKLTPSGTGSVISTSDKTGAGSLARLYAVTNNKTFYRKDGFISLNNSVDYASKIEYNGWSGKAPLGFIRTGLLRGSLLYKTGGKK